MNAGRRLTRPLLSTGKTQRRQWIIYAYFNKVCYSRETWCMIHDPCFMTCGALCEQAQFVICPRRTRKTSVRVRFGFHIFVGIKQKKPVFILEYPNGLKGATSLVKFVSGDVDAKKMGWPSWSVPWTRRRRGNKNVTKTIGLTKQNNHSSRAAAFFLYISLPSPHDYDVKMPYFTFYRGRKQETTKFSFSFLTWIRFLGI